jgi:hypothetical protein
MLVLQRTQRRTNLDDTCNSTPNWRASSWSFMSGNGYISYSSMRKGSTSHLENTERLSDCTISDCKVVPLSQEVPFGRVVSSTLRIQGWLLKVQPPRSSKHLSPHQIRISWGFKEIPMLLKGLEGDARVGTLHFDVAEIFQEEQPRIRVNS